MKPIFSLEDYQGRYAMACASKEESDCFRMFLHDNGRRWSSGRSYSEIDYFSEDPSNEFLYAFNVGLKGKGIEYHEKRLDYKVLIFSDFYWPNLSNHEEESMELTDFLNSLGGIN